MGDMLIYLFWPNPGNADYSSPKSLILLVVCVLLVVVSFAIKYWRKKQSNAVTRKLTRSWPSVTLWFGLVGLFLVICRVESISYLSMRVWWVVWGVVLVVYILFQLKMFRMRHYNVLPQKKREHDPREKYLPKSKK